MSYFRRMNSASSMDESEEITFSLKANVQEEQPELHSGLFEALKQNKTGLATRDLLKNFPTEDFDLFSKTYLPRLYNHVILGGECPIWLKDVAIKNIMQQRANNSEFLMISMGDIISRLLPVQFQRRSDLGQIYMSPPERHFKDAPNYSIRDLFLWALLSYRLELAMDIFNHAWPGADRSSLIGASITACNLLNRLADIAMGSEPKTSRKLRSSARQYKSMANCITSECYIEDRQKTKQMVLHRRPQWGDESFLVISSLLEGEESKSFRIVLDDLWTGRLKHHRYMTLKLIVAIIPLFAFVLRLPEERRVKRFNLPAKWRAYYTAPVTKFMYNAIFFIFHLMAFSYFLMTDFHHGDDWQEMNVCENLVILWVCGVTVEELRQMITGIEGNGAENILSPVWDYFTSGWNSVDWAMVLTFYAGLIARLTVDEDDFHIARILYTLSLLIMYFRSLRFATHWEYIGPKVEMIKIMMTRDLPPFLMIFFVYFVSFGIAYRVLLFPNDTLSKGAIVAIFSVPYWQLFGDMQLDIAEVTPGCTRNMSQMYADPDVERCPEAEDYPLLVPVLIGIFMIMSNILLLNIVIAVFNQTYGTVEEESSKIHRSNRYSLAEEYIARPFLPPPLNMVELFIFRPLATLLICLYWSCSRKDFHWRPHCCSLFRILMLGKEVDPPLWLRVSREQNYKYTRQISDTLDQVLAQTTRRDIADEPGSHATQQTNGHDQGTAQQIEQIFRKLNELRTLHQGMDQILTELLRSRQRHKESHSSLKIDEETSC